MHGDFCAAADPSNGDGDDIMIERPTQNELVAMLPQFFKDILEYPEIMKAWAKGLDMVGLSGQQVWDNLYIQTCDSDTLSIYEGYLKLTPAPGDSLEVRRARVLARLMIAIPYSERRIRVLFDEMYGAGNYTLIVDSINSEVTMDLQVHIEEGVLLFCTTWHEMAPAHMAFTVKEDITTDIDNGLYFGGAVRETIYTNIE